ncbi:helix-turn-helix transcriptional regulator [Actinosynnema sp. NPDC047251]|uniref:Transcriptional regulator n=1 Tax=Saccharothrix espanaensis (strain ATCC 51144 / DSM 44229 / JCM 9112 / NBRC 15066 / NRRL 15764) TaxID=1179773 RepID=K0K495_SACES|nr:helix-turn-helix transcriptional regulator [Saccharothrix espanaensis]CCH31383.1 Transcriptional regulator [Saccharothrix espanaensis DSM 44229]
MGDPGVRPPLWGAGGAVPLDEFLPLGRPRNRAAGPVGPARPPHRCAAEQALCLLMAGRDWAAAVRCAEEALADDVCRRAELCVARALSTLVYGGELVTADEHSLALAARPETAGVVALLRARLARLCGDVDRAHDLLGALAGSDAGLGTRVVAACWAVELLAECGEVDRARALAAEHGLDRVPAAGAACRPVLLAARGALAMAADRYDAAAADYLECGRELTARGVLNPAVLPWRGEAALAAFAAGRCGLASSLARQEYAAAVSWGESRTVGRALSAVAIVDARGREVELLGEAGQLLELAQAWPELGRVSYELGVRLAARGDVPAARQRLERARGLALRVGDAGRAARAERALVDLAPARRPALTRQQARIARLAIAGYSNKEIAAKLFLALRTVEFHLSSAYDKLGIAGRRELRTALVDCA